MGKGDKRSRKGKIFAGSFGKSRPKRKKKATTSAEPVSEQAPKRATRKKKSDE